MVIESEKATILLVEVERKNVPTFADALTRKGYDVLCRSNGERALSALKDASPLAIVINASSLRTTGTRLSTRFHSSAPEIPVFLIVDEVAEVFETLPDVEVMRLPFTVQKLDNRLKNLNRKYDRNLINIKDLSLNVKLNLATRNGHEHKLTPRCTQLLRLLMEKSNEVVSREDLFSSVWETDYTDDMRTLDVHISWLRKELEEDPRHPVLIKTVRKKGYTLEI